MGERKVIAERVLTEEERAKLGVAGIRDLVREFHVSLRDRGMAPGSYVLEGEDRFDKSTVFRAYTVDPMDVPLRFDDRGIH